MRVAGQEQGLREIQISGFVEFRHARARARLRGLVSRAHSDDETVAAMLENPESVLASARQVLQNDRRSKVVRIGALVLKRFNRRNRWHTLRDFFRMSDAARTWCRGWALLAAGLPTAEPIGYVESRVLGFPFRSYLVMRAVPEAVPLGVHLRRYGYPSRALIVELARVVAQFHNAGFRWNRDMNDRNILVSRGKDIVLVDVDGVRRQRAGISAIADAWRDLATLRQSFAPYPECTQAQAALFVRAYWRLRCAKSVPLQSLPSGLRFVPVPQVLPGTSRVHILCSGADLQSPFPNPSA